MKINNNYLLENSNNYRNIDCSRLVSELPAFMIYSMAMTGGNIAPHEALLLVDNDKNVASIFKETKKLAKLYKKVKRLVTNYLAALELLSSMVCTKFLAPILSTYTTLSLISGKSKEAMYMLAVRTSELFEEHIEQKLKYATVMIEVIVALLSAIIMLVVLASTIASAFPATYVILFTIITISLVAALVIRLQLLNTYINSNSRKVNLIGTLGEFLLITSLIIFKITKIYYMSLILISLSFILKLYVLCKLYKSIVSIEKLAIMSRVLSETITVGGTSYSYLMLKLKQVANKESKDIIYAIRTGRLLPSNDDINTSLSHLLARITALSVRSGGKAISSLRLASNLLELIQSSIKKAAMATLMNISLITAVAVVMQISLILIYSHFTFNLPHQIKLGAFIQPLTREQVLLAIEHIAIGSILVSYAISYAMLGKPWYNIASPIIAAALFIAEEMLN